MDPLEKDCPHCTSPNPDLQLVSRYTHHFVVPWWKQVLFFVIGFLGLQIIGVIVSLAARAFITVSNPGATTEELTVLLSDPGVSMAVNSIIYCIGAAGLSVLIFKDWPKLLGHFKHWLPYAAGLIGMLVILMFELFYGMLAENWFKALGIQSQSNANQSGINTMIVAMPALSFLIFGFVGPFTEEVTYRLGLFSFLCRVHKIVGYLVGILVFALIHFDWEALFYPAYEGHLITEVINLPPYLFAGFVFCLLYDRFGFASSLTSHVLSNVLSVAMQLIPNA